MTGLEELATRVLVVDDNADTALSTAMLLKQAGYISLAITVGSECLLAIEEFYPNVVLLDIAMPQLCGYELANRIRALPGSDKIAIVAVSGYSDFNHIRRSFDAGCDEHLIKPVELEVLQAVMERELKKRLVKA